MPDVRAIFTAEVNATSANNFANFLLANAAAGTTRLILGINSPGGNVVAGIAIYNVMMAMPYEIVTHNIGNVDSIANAMFLAGRERYACAPATFMFHSVGFNGVQGYRFEEKNLREHLDSVIADNKRIAALISARTRLTVPKAMRLFKEQRTRDAAWASENGFIAEIRDFVVPAGAGNVQMISQ